MFDTVQCKIKAIGPKKGIANKHPLSGKVWHSTDKYKKTIWRCNGKYKYGKTCSNRHVTEDELKDAYLDALNSLLESEIDET